MRARPTPSDIPDDPASATPPTLLWLRRDLRLADHAALQAAIDRGGPVIPVFLFDPETEALGAAPKWRLGLSLADLAARLEAAGSRLILRRGPALESLRALIAETGARAVHWHRLYDPGSVARDSAVKAALKAEGIAAQSHAGHVLFEPWRVQTGQGGFFRVYTPFWNAVRGRDPGAPAPMPASLPSPGVWPASDRLAAWALGAEMNRGADVVSAHICVGESAARSRLDSFLATAIDGYKTRRDRPDLPATSRLSEHLTTGEISPRQVWEAGLRAMERGARGAEHFLKELVWRDFAWHLIHHTPHILLRNWRDEWDRFPWQDDPALAWKKGMTGVPMVDAGMRELYVTGSMHNRLRMLVASYLTKHMMVHWSVGMAWFAECLIDWDPASNAMGWQWAAGSGPDAAPFFRIFNPSLQAEKFDPEGTYRRRYLAGFQGSQEATALSFFKAVPEGWALTADTPYPTAPLVGLAEGRARALAAYQTHMKTKQTA
ncbi:MAG: deoxyribodipyrimidine photo-lyase [Pseudomonadota bacterium]